MVELLDSPSISEDKSWLAPDECGSLCLLYTDMGIAGDLVRVLLDLCFIASLEAFGIGAVRVVLVGGDVGVLLALLGVYVSLCRDVSRMLRLAEETHHETTTAME